MPTNKAEWIALLLDVKPLTKVEVAKELLLNIGGYGTYGLDETEDAIDLLIAFEAFKEIESKLIVE